MTIVSVEKNLLDKKVRIEDEVTLEEFVTSYMRTHVVKTISGVEEGSIGVRLCSCGNVFADAVTSGMPEFIRGEQEHMVTVSREAVKQYLGLKDMATSERVAAALPVLPEGYGWELRSGDELGSKRKKPVTDTTGFTVSGIRYYIRVFSYREDLSAISSWGLVDNVKSITSVLQGANRCLDHLRQHTNFFDVIRQEIGVSVLEYPDDITGFYGAALSLDEERVLYDEESDFFKRLNDLEVSSKS
jgi:hypothetical protein